MYNCMSVSAECPVEATIYGYYPNLGANTFFCVFFALCCIVQTFQGIKFKTWTFMAALSLSCFTECIGYVGRILMHFNPWNNSGFEMQICCLILAPAFVSAGIYLTLSNLIKALGTEFAQLRPNSYTWIFMGADLFSLVLQACGGGIAASANTNQMTNVGSNLMLAGIVWQVASLLVFATLTTIYLVRVWRSRQQLSPGALAVIHSKSSQFFAAGILVAFITVFIRCVYRIPEMSGGWESAVMQDETDFIVLDGVMITIAVLALTVCHPRQCVPDLWRRGGSARSPSETKSVAVSNSSVDVERGMEEIK